MREVPPRTGGQGTNERCPERTVSERGLPSDGRSRARYRGLTLHIGASDSPRNTNLSGPELALEPSRPPAPAHERTGEPPTTLQVVGTNALAHVGAIRARRGRSSFTPTDPEPKPPPRPTPRRTLRPWRSPSSSCPPRSRASSTRCASTIWRARRARCPA